MSFIYKLTVFSSDAWVLNVFSDFKCTYVKDFKGVHKHKRAKDKSRLKIHARAFSFFQQWCIDFCLEFASIF